MMDLKNRMAEEFEKRKDGLLVFALLLGLGFFINRGVTIKGLYMDDLYLWSCYGEQSFLEYVFPMGSTRFRFLYYLISWLELAFVGNHVTWIVPINIVLNAAIAFTIYRIAFRIGGRRFVSIALSVAYLLSRMAYYQIGQLYGTMESMGLWAAIGILYFLYRYVNERDGKSYLLANVLYFCASFIHERYMALIPVLLLALLLGQSKKVQKSDGDMEAAYGKSRRRRTEEEYRTPKWQFFLLSIGIFGLIMLIRLFTIGTLSPAGTGGTDVADTFDTAEAVAHAWEQVGFVFGVGTGPDYLCGMTFADSPDNIKNMIHACWGILGVLVAVFSVRWGVGSGRGRFPFKKCPVIPGLYRALHRLLQRDNPRGDALGLCGLCGGALIPLLPFGLRGKGGDSRVCLYGTSLSGGGLLSGYLGRAPSLAEPASVQLPGRGDRGKIRRGLF